MASNKELKSEIPSVIRLYKDGTVERLKVAPFVPPSLNDPITGISSKDVIISPNVSARLYLPKLTTTKPQKLPILVYVHGGGFVIGSAFTRFEHNFISTVVSYTNALVVSVEYRLAPEHYLPTAYEDCWTALQWVASHSTIHNGEINIENPEPWLVEFGDFNRLYIGGNSSGANIVHNLALKAGNENLKNDVKILGGFLNCPYFWGSKFGSINPYESYLYKYWMFAYPDAPGGIDNPMVNPFVNGQGFAAEFGYRKVLVVVAEKDELRDIDVKYVEAVKESEWDGDVEFLEIQGEDHCFCIYDSTTDKANILMEKLASFIV